MNVIADNENSFYMLTVDKMLYDNSKWWNKFYDEAIKLVKPGEYYFKEKYWRFDTSYWWDTPWVQDILFELETESEETCQRCAKHSHQIWTDWWRVRHWCWKCYIISLCKRYRDKIKYKFKKGVSNLT